jgi:hypothetical protein
MSFWKDIKEEHINGYKAPANTIEKVNNHLHTPHSFSAFSSIQEALKQAQNEGISVLGINDFFSCDGYNTWALETIDRGIFPLFNIEFVGLNEGDKKQGLKVNDPANPGRTYLSGKSLAYPPTLSEATTNKLKTLVHKANQQVEQMMHKVNALLEDKGYSFVLNFEEMKTRYAKSQVRERHLARAIRRLIEEQFSDPQRQLTFYHLLFGGRTLAAPLNNAAEVENEIRSRLLKAGGAAYVEEDPSVFLDTDTIRSIILEAGGVPTYPFLADDAKGNYTDFERNLPKTIEQLKARGFYSVEFIPTRNDSKALKDYVLKLEEAGFIVTFGTEHNSPGKQPIEVFAKDGVALDEDLLRINYEGSCILAAHQFLMAHHGKGILDGTGAFISHEKENFKQLGHKLIQYIVSEKQ